MNLKQLCLLALSSNKVSNVDRSALESSFKIPPDSARPGTWWHWMGGSVTKRGITADLEAMKRVGLRSVTLFNAGLGVPDGPVKFMSDEWRSLFKHAAQEASRLGLKLGFHNCEGWATSGGTWISEEETMQKITSSRMQVSGPGLQTFQVPQPEITTKPHGHGPNLPLEPYFRNIAVFAIKTTGDDEPIDMSMAKVTCRGQQVKQLTDGDKHTGTILPKASVKKPQIITFEFSEPVSARGIKILAMTKRQGHTGELQTSINGIDYKPLAPFQMLNESGSASFPMTTSRYWRVVFTKTGWSANALKIAEVELSVDSRITNLQEKAGYSKLPHPRNLLNFSRVHHAAEGIPRASVIDLTDKLSLDGTIEWNVPSGNWTILRLGHTATGERNHPVTVRNDLSLECNKLDKSVVAKHYQSFAGKLIKDIGPLAGQSVDHILFDSWEAKTQNWNQNLIEQFKAYRGYDPTPYLPVLDGFVLESEEISERFLWDFRRTLADLLADTYYGTLRQLSNADGLDVWAEVYNGSNFDTFQSASRVNVPMTEFWYKRGVLARGNAKHAASVAHASGQPIVAAEAFTSDVNVAGWEAHPFELKFTGDISLADGVNRMIIHTWVHQPWPELSPGLTLGPYGMHFNAQNTWFKHADEWINYLTRCQFLLQQGQFKADVAIFVEEDAPNTLGRTDSAQRDGIPLGYDYDYIHSETLMKATVKHGRITLASGMSYRLLVFKKSETMTPKVAMKVRQLVQAGALILGPKPKRSPSLVGFPKCDTDVLNVANDVWGPVDGKNVKYQPFGKGMVYHGMNINDVLKAEKVVPDLINSRGRLSWQHRLIGDADFYFVANSQQEDIKTELSFKVCGKVPEFWYPDTGKIEPCGVWRVDGKRTIIPLELYRNQSLFVVFRETGTPKVTGLHGSGARVEVCDGEAHLVASKNGRYSLKTVEGVKSIDVNSLGPVNTISGPWHVSFPPNLGAPESTDLKKLISLSEHKETGIKYFSGTATYTTDFQVHKSMIANDKKLMIDLGRVEVIAEVLINDKEVGTLWKPPFQIDVSSLVELGENKLEIRVTNSWRNRLIGDAQKPQRHFSKPGKNGSRMRSWPQWLLNGEQKPDDGCVTFTTHRHHNKNASLSVSGLIGPVQMYSKERIALGSTLKR